MALLFLGSVVNYLDRAVLGVLMPSIRHDLGLTNTGYAMAVNAFLVTYTLSYIAGGRVADLLGCRRTFSLTLLVWSAAATLHAAARASGVWPHAAPCSGLAKAATIRRPSAAPPNGFLPLSAPRRSDSCCRH